MELKSVWPYMRQNHSENQIPHVAHIESKPKLNMSKKAALIVTSGNHVIEISLPKILKNQALTTYTLRMPDFIL